MILHSTEMQLTANDARRRWFGSLFIILSLGMLIWGVTLLSAYLVQRPILFLLYWAGCAALTGLALINALMDMIIMRKRSRDEQVELARKSFQAIIDEEKRKQAEDEARGSSTK